jgi:hypothetical protein
MAAGAGYYFVAVVATIVALFSLIVLKYSEDSEIPLKAIKWDHTF